MIFIEPIRRRMLLRLLLSQMISSIIVCICDIFNTVLYRSEFESIIGIPAFGYGLGLWTSSICLIFLATPVSLILSGNYYDRYRRCCMCSLGFCCALNLTSVMIDQLTLAYETCLFVYAASRSETWVVAMVALISLVATLIHAVLTIILIKIFYKEKYRRKQLLDLEQNGSEECRNIDNNGRQNSVVVYQPECRPISTTIVVTST